MSRWQKAVEFIAGMAIGSIIIGTLGVKYGAGWVAFMGLVSLVWDQISGFDE